MVGLIDGGEVVTAEVFHQVDHFEQRAAVEVGNHYAFGIAGKVDGIVPVGEAEQRQAMLAGIVFGEGESALQVVEYRPGLSLFQRKLFVVIGNPLVEEDGIAGLFNVSADGLNDPEVVVAVPFFTLFFAGVAFVGFHGERKELMHGGTVGQLHAQQLAQQAAGIVRNTGQHAHHVLRAVAKPEAARTEPELIERQVARPVEGGVALARVMDVDHGIERGVGGLALEAGQILVPEFSKGWKNGVHVFQCLELFGGGGDGVRFILPELGDKAFGFAGSHFAEFVHQRGDDIAAARFAVGKMFVLQLERVFPGAILIVAQEFFAVGLKGIDRRAGGEKVVFNVLLEKGVLAKQDSAVAVRFGIDGHGLRAPVGVGILLERVKMSEFNDRDGVEFDRGVTDVGDADVAQDDVFARRHKDGDVGANSDHFGNNTLIAETNAAFVFVVRVERRHKEGREDLVAARLFDAQVEGFAFKVGAGQLRDIFGDSIQGRVAFADQRPASVIHQSAESQRPHIIRPLYRRLGIRDHVFPFFIIKISVFHNYSQNSAEISLTTFAFSHYRTSTTIHFFNELTTDRGDITNLPPVASCFPMVGKIYRKFSIPGMARFFLVLRRFSWNGRAAFLTGTSWVTS